MGSLVPYLIVVFFGFHTAGEGMHFCFSGNTYLSRKFFHKKLRGYLYLSNIVPGS